MPANRDRFIMVDKDLMDDPLLLNAAARLAAKNELCWHGEDLNDVDATWIARARYMSALIRLWCYADTYIRDDDTLPMGDIEVDMQVGLPGFCEVSPPEWLVFVDDNTVRLPGYCLKNDVVGRRERAKKKAESMRKYRSELRDNHVPTTLQARADKQMPIPDTRYKKETVAIATAKKVATRLPTDFTLTEERSDYAVIQGVADPRRTFERFTDYWLAAPNPQGRKLDWDAVWRNWCRTEADRGRRGAPTARAARLTQETALAAIDAAAQQQAHIAGDDTD